MEEEKRKTGFGKGFLVGGLVGLGVGVAGTCVAAALMDDTSEDEIEGQEVDSKPETEKPETCSEDIKRTAEEIPEDDDPIGSEKSEEEMSDSQNQ